MVPESQRGFILKTLLSGFWPRLESIMMILVDTPPFPLVVRRVSHSCGSCERCLTIVQFGTRDEVQLTSTSVALRR